MATLTTDAVEATRSLRTRLLGIARRRPATTDWTIAAFAVLLVVAPLPFRRSQLAADFTNSVWLVDAARNAFSQAFHPTYFVNASTQNVVVHTSHLGVFVPYFAFYGGPLFTLTGILALILFNHSLAALELVTIAACAGCYGGALWICRQVGLTRLASHVPGLCVMTSAYYMTNLYGRGAWTEFVAVSMLPPLVASAVWLVRSPSWRPWPVLALVVSTVLLTGSHNITLLWGPVAVIGTLILLWLGQNTPRELPWLRIAQTCGVIVIAAAVNAWFLFPDIRFSDLTRVTQYFYGGTELHQFATLGVLFNPLRHAPADVPGSQLMQVPIWFLVWSVVAAAMLLRSRSLWRLRRSAFAFALVTVVFLFLVMNVGVWRHMPHALTSVQFSWRLLTYVDLAVAGMVAVALLALQRREASISQSCLTAPALLSWLRVGLLVACVISVALTMWQGWFPSTVSVPPVVSVNATAPIDPISPYLAPQSWYDWGLYADASAPVVRVPAGRVLTIDPSAVHGGDFSKWVTPPPGSGPILTNIAGGPYLVKIAGMRRIGRNSAGFTVLQRQNGGRGRVHLSISTAKNSTIILGEILSILAVLGVIGLVVATTSARSRRALRRFDGSIDGRPSDERGT